jgi:lysylphosphatidylglycerol synthetase-like protein (DUF2156 family)
MARDRVVIDYPNREKSSSKATKAVVVLLLLVVAALFAIVTFGGWEQLQGMKAISIFYILVLLVCAFFIARWRSGLLPVAAALAMILLIFAAVSGPEWFARDKDGFAESTIEASVLGLLTLLIVPVCVLLIGFALSGFSQNWQTEVERRVPDDGYDDGPSRGRGAVAAPA